MEPFYLLCSLYGSIGRTEYLNLITLDTILFPRPLQIQGQQLLQDLPIGQVVRPAIGRKDSFVQLFVGQFQPGGREES
jgi:hypothetical protein